MTFRDEELPALQRPRSAGGSIAKEEVDRVFIHSMSHSSVSEMLMRDEALRDTYQALMDTEGHKPKSFLERVKEKAREDHGGLDMHSKDEGWLVHKYMADLQASRQDCKEARQRIGHLMDRVKSLEGEVQRQTDAAARMKEKADALEHEKLDRERALGAGLLGDGRKASEEEARERCEELTRECTLKDQIISLLQTENKSAKAVVESRVRELETKLNLTQGHLASLTSAREEERASSDKALHDAELAAKQLKEWVDAERHAQQREQAMRKAVEDTAQIEKARFQEEIAQLREQLAAKGHTVEASAESIKDLELRVAQALKEASLSRSELSVAKRELSLAQQTTEATLKEKEQARKEVERLKAEVALVEREVAAKKSEVSISQQEKHKLAEELAFAKGEVAAAVAQKKEMEDQLRGYLSEVADLDSAKAAVAARLEAAEKEAERAGRDAEAALRQGRTDEEKVRMVYGERIEVSPLPLPVYVWAMFAKCVRDIWRRMARPL